MYYNNEMKLIKNGLLSILLLTCSTSLFHSFPLLFNDYDHILGYESDGDKMILVMVMNDSPRQVSGVIIRDGKRIKVISPTQGRGPGETLLDFPHFHIDPYHKTICLFDNRLSKLILWDLNGRYLDEYNLPFSANDMHPFKNGYVFKSSQILGRDFIVTDTHFKILKKTGHDNKAAGMKGIEAKQFFWDVLDDWIIKLHQNDFSLTCFHITSGEEVNIPLNKLLKENDYKISLYEDHTEEGMKAPIVWANIERVFSLKNMKKVIITLRPKDDKRGAIIIDFPSLNPSFMDLDKADVSNFIPYHGEIYHVTVDHKYRMMSLEEVANFTQEKHE